MDTNETVETPTPIKERIKNIPTRDQVILLPDWVDAEVFIDRVANLPTEYRSNTDWVGVMLILMILGVVIFKIYTPVDNLIERIMPTVQTINSCGENK